MESGFQRRNRTLLRTRTSQIWRRPQNGQRPGALKDKGQIEEACSPHLEESRACSASCFFRYEWSLTPWSSCQPLGDSTCGEGQRRRGVRCLRLNDGRAVRHHFCPASQRPRELETWCPIDCPVDCEVSPWSPWHDASCKCGSTRPGDNMPLMKRTRVVTTRASPSGRPCPAVMAQTKACPAWPCYKLSYSLAICDLQGAACGIGRVLRNVTCIREGASPPPPFRRLRDYDDDLGGRLDYPPPEAVNRCSREDLFGTSSLADELTSTASAGGDAACFKPCPTDCLLSEWSSWTPCQGPCVGTRTRKHQFFVCLFILQGVN